MSDRARWWLLVPLVLLLAGCGASDEAERQAEESAPDEPAATIAEDEVEEGDVAPTELELEEIDDSGVSGTVRVGAGSGDALSIEVELDGDATGTHGIEARAGSCADAIAPDVTDELLAAAGYTLADIEDGTMQDEAEVPADIVGEGNYALVVYEGEDVEGDVAACAEVLVE